MWRGLTGLHMKCVLQCSFLWFWWGGIKTYSNWTWFHRLYVCHVTNSTSQSKRGVYTAPAYTCVLHCFTAWVSLKMSWVALHADVMVEKCWHHRLLIMSKWQDRPMEKILFLMLIQLFYQYLDQHRSAQLNYSFPLFKNLVDQVV